MQSNVDIRKIFLKMIPNEKKLRISDQPSNYYVTGIVKMDAWKCPKKTFLIQIIFTNPIRSFCSRFLKLFIAFLRFNKSNYMEKRGTSFSCRSGQWFMIHFRGSWSSSRLWMDCNSTNWPSHCFVNFMAIITNRWNIIVLFTNIYSCTYTDG